jgi:hypothetical protein
MSDYSGIAEIAQTMTDEAYDAATDVIEYMVEEIVADEETMTADDFAVMLAEMTSPEEVVSDEWDSIFDAPAVPIVESVTITHGAVTLVLTPGNYRKNTILRPAKGQKGPGRIGVSFLSVLADGTLNYTNRRFEMAVIDAKTFISTWKTGLDTLDA